VFTLSDLKFITKPYKKVIPDLGCTEKVFESDKVTGLREEVMKKTVTNGFVVVITIVQIVMANRSSQKAAYTMLNTGVVPAMEYHFSG
jgi:hypothetical protein